MWRMLVGFLPLSQPAGAVYPGRPILFQSGNLLFFFPSPPFSSLPIRLKSLGKPSRATRTNLSSGAGHRHLPKAQQWPRGLCSGHIEPGASTPIPAFPRSWAAPNQPLRRNFPDFKTLAQGGSISTVSTCSSFHPWTCWESQRKHVESRRKEPIFLPPTNSSILRPKREFPGRIQPRCSVTCCSIMACCCCRRAWSWGGERICCICCGVIICGDIMATDTGTCGSKDTSPLPTPTCRTRPKHQQRLSQSISTSPIPVSPLDEAQVCPLGRGNGREMPHGTRMELPEP